MAAKPKPRKPPTPATPTERKSASMAASSWFTLCVMLRNEKEKLEDVIAAIEGAILTRGKLSDGERRVRLTPTTETCSLICSTSLRVGKALSQAAIISRSSVIGEVEPDPKPVPAGVMEEAVANAREELETIQKGEFQND